MSQTIVSHLYDCCLGWVFFRKGQNAFKATCEGAVIFFKHGKTFARNMGRVFGMDAVSFVGIAGRLTALFYLILARFPQTFQTLSAEFAKVAVRNDSSSWVWDILSNPLALTIAAAFVIAVVIWAVIHSAFIRPLVLVGVLRNYLASGMQDVPSESSFAMLKGKAVRFDRLQTKLG